MGAGSVVLRSAYNGLLVGPLATLAWADANKAKMGYPGKSASVDQDGAFGLHFPKCHLGFVIVMIANGVDDNADLLVALEQPQRRGLDSPFGADTHKNELCGADFAEQPVNSRLIKRVGAALVENHLLVAA
jgi:hypothetical protein